jgi:phosphopantetheinyl transferase
VTLCLLEFPGNGTPPTDADWDALADACLDGEETTRWRAFASPKRRHEWLLGRIAVKDAVRRHLADGGGPLLPPASIPIAADAWGRPYARAPRRSGDARLPSISIAHTDGVAIGAAVATGGLGVDVERLDRRRGAFEPAAFDQQERRRLEAGSADGARERALRLFCAKEAAAKALGRGFMGSPLNLTTLEADADLSRLTLVPAGRLAEALPRHAGRPIEARVRCDAGLVVALARCDAVENA